MKNVYTTIIAFSFLFLIGCSKDFLKSYEHRIVGTWRITDVNQVGIGGNTDNLPSNKAHLILMMMGSHLY